MINKVKLLSYKYALIVLTIVAVIIATVITIVMVVKTRGKPTTSDEWVLEMITKHNYYRKLHNVPPLYLNKSICPVSQGWANHLGATKKFEHNYNDLRKYALGENLSYYWVYDSQLKETLTVNGSRAVVSWYNEIEFYDFKTGKSKNGSAVGHFTQVVWKATRSMCAAMVSQLQGKTSTAYVVANYYPPGNVVGRYQENVPPPLHPVIQG